MKLRLRGTTKPTTQRPPQGPQHSRRATVTIPVATPDGWTLHLEHFAPPADAAPRAALLLGHAMMVDRRTFDRPRGAGMASFLAHQHHHVYALDVRGHGDSKPRASRDVDWSYDDIVDIDLPAALRGVAARHPGLPLVLVGHSLCGHTGAACLGRHPDLRVAALVMLGANIWLPRFEPSHPHRALKAAIGGAWAAVSAATGYFPARKLRIGTDDEARTYVAQSASWVRSGRWTDLRGNDYLEALARVWIPTLAINARGDHLLSRTVSAQRFALSMTSAPVTFWEASAADTEAATDPDHMTLVTSPTSRPVWAQIDRWLQRTL